MSELSQGNSSLKDRVQSLRLPPPGASAEGSLVLPWILVLVLASAVVYLLLMGSPFSNGAAIKDSSATQAAASNIEKPASVSTAASPSTGPVVESKGYIIPEQQILVSPQVSGRVIELNFEAGQRIERDFVLAVLDSTEYQAEYERVTALLEASKENLAELREGSRPDEIKQVKAELAESQTNLEQAERDYKRLKELVTSGFGNRQDFETAESQYQMIKKRVDKLAATTQLMVDGPRRERKRAAEAQVRQAEAELRRAKWRLDNCIIVAPISGTVLKKNAELGNLVNPIAFNGSFSLCDIADLSKLEVELSIQERDIAKVKKGQRCKIQPEAYMDRSYDGVVSRLSDTRAGPIKSPRGRRRSVPQTGDGCDREILR
jgi:HlyD family secretion protein